MSLRFGSLLGEWTRRPNTYLLISVSWYIAVLFGAYSLGILKTFKLADGRTVPGFWSTQWGALFLFAMPLVTWVFAKYLVALSAATSTLDVIIKPKSAGLPLFTSFLERRHFRAHQTWIRWIALVTPIALTALADGADILAPLQLSWPTPSNESDWATRGFQVAGASSAYLYLAFNTAAWVMQLFVGFCAMYLLLTTGLVLGTVFHDGIGGRRIFELLSTPGASKASVQYEPSWDFTRRRCGLDDMDWVFLIFVGINILALLLCAVSILTNAYWKLGADLGSDFLVVGCLFFLPASAAWVFLPYFTAFPHNRPSHLTDAAGCVDPSPWPFGSKSLARILIAAVFGLWAFLFWQALKFLFPGIDSKSGG